MLLQIFLVMRLLAVTHMMRTGQELVYHQHHVKTLRGDGQPPCIGAAMSSYRGRDRVGSFDSTRSEDGLTCKATICERAQNNGDGDLEKRLRKVVCF